MTFVPTCQRSACQNKIIMAFRLPTFITCATPTYHASAGPAVHYNSCVCYAVTLDRYVTSYMWFTQVFIERNSVALICVLWSKCFTSHEAYERGRPVTIAQRRPCQQVTI